MHQVFSDKMRWINILGAFFMLMTHANPLQFYSDAEKWTVCLVQYGISLAVPAVAWFFFSAGYWLFRGLDRQKILPRMKKRFFSLVIPFILWNALVLMAECFLRVYKLQPITMDFLLSAFSPLSPVNGALWFISRLISYVIILPLLYPLLCCKKFSAVMIFFGTVLSIALCPDYYSFFYWLTVFCTGGWIALYEQPRFEKLLVEHSFLTWKTGLLIFGFLQIIALPAVQMGGRAIYMVRLLSVPCSILLMAVCSCPKAKGWFVSRISFFLFCTHWYVESLIGGKLAKLIPAYIPGAALWCYMLICVATATLSIVLMLLLHRFTPRLLSILSGGR